MDNANGIVKCPLCDGHGELAPTDFAERLAKPELRKRLDSRITEILESVHLARTGSRERNFQSEVHQWNPQLPIWRRSPKE